MASYRLEIKRSAAKELAQLPPKDRARIVAGIRALADDPRQVGAEKLSGQERYRVRQRDYRILCDIEDQILRIKVVRRGHRRDVYRS